MSAPYSMRQFANALAEVAADTAMQPVLDGLERDLAAWKRQIAAAVEPRSLISPLSENVDV